MNEFKKVFKIFVLAVIVSALMFSIPGISASLFVGKVIYGVLTSVIATFVTILALIGLLSIPKVNEWMDK